MSTENQFPPQENSPMLKRDPSTFSLTSKPSNVLRSPWTLPRMCINRKLKSSQSRAQHIYSTIFFHDERGKRQINIWNVKKRARFKNLMTLGVSLTLGKQQLEVKRAHIYIRRAGGLGGICWICVHVEAFFRLNFIISATSTAPIHIFSRLSISNLHAMGEEKVVKSRKKFSDQFCVSLGVVVWGGGGWVD